MNHTSPAKLSLALLALASFLAGHVRAQVPPAHAPGQEHTHTQEQGQEHEHAHPHGHEHPHVPAPALVAGSMPEAWAQAQAALQAMQRAAAENQMLPMHSEQEKFAALLKQIQAKAGAGNARLEGALRNTIAASERVHLASDANDFAKAAADLKTLAATMALLEKQLAPLLAVASGSIKAEWIAPTELQAGKTARAVLRLTAQGKPVTLDMLQVAHTEKLHLLIIEQTLTDYHHEHPVPAERPGEYAFDFTPRFGGTYLIWADVVPTATGQQEYARAQVEVQGTPATSNRAINTAAEAGGLHFQFATEDGKALRAGAGTVVHLSVRGPEGQEFAGLEPVMGAFAHMVAFPADIASVMHIHPMGKEPQTPGDRGGPRLSFHVEPAQAGFHKFFLQVQVNGQPLFAAFGQEVLPASAGTVTPAAAKYACPMHPEVVSDQPGKCPKCGMSLLPK